MSDPKKYRKKPVTIEAMIFTGHNANEVEAWIEGDDAEGGWGPCDFWEIETLEGTMMARLVPETAEQDEEPEFDPACTYLDRAAEIIAPWTEKEAYVTTPEEYLGYIYTDHAQKEDTDD